MRTGERTEDMEEKASQQEMELMEKELAVLRSRLEYLSLKIATFKGSQKEQAIAIEEMRDK